MKPWKTVRKELVSDHPPRLRIESHEVGLPDGRTITDWMWVEVPDFVNVAVVDTQGDFICFRQPKYAVSGITYAVVGGYVDSGETPEQAAYREVEEEAGYAIGTLTSFGRYAMDGNRGCGVGYLFLAEGCTETTKAPSDDLEEQEMLKLSRDELKQALFKGAFGVASWTATLALALLVREKE